MRMRHAVAAPSDSPMSELNTTPLIDVMLVLLIMFIITMPVSSHEVPLDLPQPGPRTSEPVVHRLQIDAAGGLTLDGAAVAGADLRRRLGALAAEPDSTLQLSADPETRYERFDQVLAVVRAAGVSRLGMDNGRFAGAVR